LAGGLFYFSEVKFMPNAKVLESKKVVVEALTGKIKEATSVVFVDYKGITVAQDTALRQQFREAGVEYSVVKNTLTRFAAKNVGYDFDEVLNGTTAMACTTGDPIAPARIVCEFAKKNKLPLAIKGGVVEGSVLTAAELNGFGELPSKNALVASVLGTFLAPISSLAFVLDQVRIQKESGVEPAAAAEAPAEEAAPAEAAEATEA
jgi:large subunit ribosomal protein L10